MRLREKELVLSALHGCADSLTAISFVDQLLTESEKLTIGRRILIAQMILSGHSQAEIREILNVSPNTFTRTRKWLNGQIPNYDKALKEYGEQINKRDSTQTKNKNYDPTTFQGLRNKYPMHFLFFNLAEELLHKLHS